MDARNRIKPRQSVRRTQHNWPDILQLGMLIVYTYHKCTLHFLTIMLTQRARDALPQEIFRESVEPEKGGKVIDYHNIIIPNIIILIIITVLYI